ncbi:thioesterase family protein [Aeromicrobium sp.]|uniref:thioesterase family protein n=1 Tax=Aeromicrobium sp. TaxID=1871063 RepID=UPI003C368874
MSTLPTYDQIRQIPAHLERSVPAEFIDENGHMNIGRYLQLGGTALWDRCQRELGMPEDYIAARGLSTFTVEHHLTYLSEMIEGEKISVHVRLIARSDKALHSVSLIVNESQRRLACVMEATLVHMDMTTRRPTPFPDDVRDLLDSALKQDDVAWPAPLSGSMGVRRSA